MTERAAEGLEQVGSARARRRVIWLLVGLAAAALIAPSLARLSYNAWLGAAAAGLCFAPVAMGVYLSFRVLDYPDLTIDGSLPLGAAVSAAMITSGWDPYYTLPAAALAGSLAGLVTALIATRMRIHSLLASILTTTALFSINLHVMGRSNIPLLNEPTIFARFTPGLKSLLSGAGGPDAVRYTGNLAAIALAGLVVVLIKIVFDWFMRTEYGLGLQAAGNNPQMARALGVPTDRMALFGLALSNALVGLSGAIFAQYQGFADINMGTGLIIAGLAAVILGETFFRPRGVAAATAAVIFGMIIYRLVIAAALNIAVPLPGGETLRIDPLDVKLATSVLVLAALWITRLQKGAKRL